MPCDISTYYLDCELVPGLPLIPFLAFAGIIIAVVYFWPRKKDEYEKPKLIEPDSEIYKEFKDVIKTTGYSIPYTSLFYIGHILKGRVMRWTFYRWEREVDINKLAKKNRTAERLAAQVRKDYRADNFYLLEVIPYDGIFILDWIRKFLYMLVGFGAKYYLADMKFFSNRGKDNFITSKHWLMTMFSQQKRFYDKLYVYSEFGQRVIQGMVNHLTVKQILKDQVNHIPQMHYFDYKTGKFAAKARELQDLRDKSWKKREESLEKEVDGDD